MWSSTSRTTPSSRLAAPAKHRSKDSKPWCPARGYTSRKDHMRTRVRPALVEVYHDGESVNLPSQNLIPYNKAAEAVMEGRGQWRDHGRKLRMFTSWRETDDA